ncbi:MAG: S46 family peptidase [Bacteroidales bacterium]|nr:MAG: S46 family peptidase [Bacteroidales bacterium]
MLKRILLICILFIFCDILYLSAEEGLWPPFLLNKENINEMQLNGLRLSAEDIFSNQNTSLKDAIVLFNKGCTGEIISGEGLLLTNYHCGFRYIQSLSTVDNDYMTSGYWARSREDELPAPDLTVSFLSGVEDVTVQILGNIDSILDEEERQNIINKRIDSITVSTSDDPYRVVRIKPFYYGNNYYMFIYDVFKDIRLVGTPPGNIGKFGGDTDNWIWPRHTGDFSLFRIYSNNDNMPAEYSPDNVPYKPKKYLQISLKGIREGDFTMAYGYPARTYQFLTSHQINILKEHILPYKIKFREARREIIKPAMEADNETRIKYAAKYESLSNAWKKWTGILDGYKRTDIIEIKKKLELDFILWANTDSTLKEKYGYLMSEFDRLYEELLPYYAAKEFFYETLLGTELIIFISRFNNLLYYQKENAQTTFSSKIDKLEEESNKFFKDYSIDVDRQVFTRMMELYYNSVDRKFHPEIMEQVINKSKGNFSKYAKYIYSKSLLIDQNKVNKFLQNFSMAASAKIEDDPAFQIYASFVDLFRNTINPKVDSLNMILNGLYREYINGLFEMQQGRKFYPDANHTLRLSYGNIKGYKPGNAVYYNYYTTLTGIIEKNLNENPEYAVPQQLLNLYQLQDFGKYGINNTVPVCFIATNHTSGGSSGSPVFNADGHLIGINFDRNWEGTVSDYFYDPNICRNISVDIRYILFIIDKYAGAGHLLDEMSLIYR